MPVGIIFSPNLRSTLLIGDLAVEPLCVKREKICYFRSQSLWHKLGRERPLHGIPLDIGLVCIVLAGSIAWISSNKATHLEAARLVIDRVSKTLTDIRETSSFGWSGNESGTRRRMSDNWLNVPEVSLLGRRRRRKMRNRICPRVILTGAKFITFT